MLINAFIVAVSALHVRWRNKRYERSRWMIVAALIGLAIQYVVQMFFGFRAIDDSLGAVINILIYTPCFSLISMSVYNIETTRAKSSKMNIVCGVIYAAILLVFGVSVYLHHSLFIKEGLYMMLALFCASVVYCIAMILREMSRRKKMLETMSATDMLPYVRYSRASVVILLLASLTMPVAILSITLLYIIGPIVLLALLFFNLSFIALGSNYTPTEELLDKEEERQKNGGNAKSVKAMSWTLDYEKALWFAKRFDSDGTVYTAEIEKSNILALFDGRDESEIVVEHAYLLNIEEYEEENIGLLLT